MWNWCIQLQKKCFFLFSLCWLKTSGSWACHTSSAWRSSTQNKSTKNDKERQDQFMHTRRREVRWRVHISVKCGWCLVKKKKLLEATQSFTSPKESEKAVRVAAQREGRNKTGGKTSRGVSVRACVCEEGGVRKTLRVDKHSRTSIPRAWQITRGRKRQWRCGKSKAEPGF